MPRLSSIFAALVCVGATVIFLLPPPQGMTVTAMHAAAQLVFSGFASATLWLVLGGLILAQAVYHTGLAQRIAGALFDRYTRSYRQLVAALVIVSILVGVFFAATLLPGAR